MDRYDTLLLSAVHKGDVKSLKTILSTISDPELYLNRVYDEPDGQKHTLLMIACLTGDEDMVDILLNEFKPDLEILNVVEIDDNDFNSETYENVTVLWAATAVDNLSIVKQLVKHGANVNHTTKTNSTPIRCACYSGNVDMARYLVENGADIHIKKKDNETNLSLSAYYKRLKMVTYLIDELGCDVNECDDSGRSPLHFAVKCKSLDIIRLLLNRGAKNLRTTSDKMSPLMLAAENRSVDIMSAIAPYCTIPEQIEAEELLGSAFACAELGSCDLQRSYDHFCQAIKLRLTHNLPKVMRESVNEVFFNRQECQTIEQLNEIRLNQEHMYTEAFLIRERLLGPANEKYRYTLIYRGAMLGDNHEFQKTIAFWLYEHQLRQQYSIPIDRQRMRRFASVFCKMIDASMPIPIEAFLTVITAVIEKLKGNSETEDYNLLTLLFLITITTQPSVDVLFSTTDRKKFYQLIHHVSKCQYVTHNQKYNLLHLCLNELTSAPDEWISRYCKYPNLPTTRLLLQCKTNANAIDAMQNTPLHILASNLNIYDANIFQLLCDYGAHLDYVNELGETPFDVASSAYTKNLLKAKMTLTLKCLCAKLIQKFKIPLQGMVSNSLLNFVERH